ncbi:hypothetical protein QFC21_005084 [Naganishia friedmannii]|uniref:Uncharacterized protein n=1 Tax=Naganishia friedmannii TaxID=89922 RepID=A0ACC2VCL8_9TREE|nr:hypothetical protein QFC21_005084 [Naganishia friedmannii]
MSTDLHSLPAGSRPDGAIRNNGPDDLALQRFKLRELAEGWPMYRDAREWDNFRSLFDKEAFVYTTWTGRTAIADFIKASQKGMDNGAFIMHRIHGSSVDITPDATRAVVKMKASITQRFSLPPQGYEVDAESDCRFCMFFHRNASTDNEWKVKYVRHFYEKDKLIPVDPRKVPTIDDDLLEQFPVGYRYLAYCQQTVMGVQVKRDMPGHRGEEHDRLIWQCKQWLEGEDVDI